MGQWVKMGQCRTTGATSTTAAEAAPGGEDCADAEEDSHGETVTTVGREEEKQLEERSPRCRR